MICGVDDVAVGVAQTSNTAEGGSTLLYQYLYNTLRWPLSSAVLAAGFIIAKLTTQGRRVLWGAIAFVIAFAFLPFWIQ